MSGEKSSHLILAERHSGSGKITHEIAGKSDARPRRERVPITSGLEIKELISLAYLTPAEQTAVEARLSDESSSQGLPEHTPLEMSAQQKISDVKEDPMSARIRAEMITREVTKAIEQEIRNNLSSDTDVSDLSPLHHSILQQLLLGKKTVKEVATANGVSVRTVARYKADVVETLRQQNTFTDIATSLAEKMPLNQIRLNINQLSGRYRTLLLEQYVNGRNNEEIATILGVNKRTVENMRDRALSTLRSTTSKTNTVRVITPAELSLLLEHPILKSEITKEEQEILISVIIRGQTIKSIAERLALILILYLSDCKLDYLPLDKQEAQNKKLVKKISLWSTIY